jgi:hypothetical protein
VILSISCRDWEDNNCIDRGDIERVGTGGRGRKGRWEEGCEVWGGSRVQSP